MDASKMPCAHCAFRRKAESKPRSLIGWLWRLHARICPGWKAYQRALAKEAASRP